MPSLPPRRAALALAAAVLALSASTAATAGAATLCVEPVGSCVGRRFATVAEAVREADTVGGADVVQIGAGVHNLGRDGVFVTQPDTELRGAGRDTTVLTIDPPAFVVGSSSTILSGYMSVSDLTLRLPTVITATNVTVLALDLYAGVAERVRVDAQGAAFGPGLNDGSGQGIFVRGGTLRDVEVAFNPTADASGISIGANNAKSTTLEDVTVTANGGIDISPQPAMGQPNVPVAIRRLRVTARSPIRVSSGAVTVSDALMRSVPPATPGDQTLAVSMNGNAPGATLALDRVTLVGDGARSIAFAVSGVVPTLLHARHVALAGFATTLYQSRDLGDTTARIEHSLADTSATAVIVEGNGRGAFVQDLATGNRSGDPLFANAAAGDYRLLTGSPAIDIGGADLIAGAATDLGGAARPTDGDGDGVTANDAGAFEAATLLRPGGPQDTLRPTIGRASLTARRFSVGARPTAVSARRSAPPTGTAFRLTLSEAASVRIALQRKLPGRRGAGRSARCARPSRANRGGRRCTRWVAAGTLSRARLGSGAQRITFSGRVGRRALKPGSYRATIVATDAAGNRSTASTLAFTVVARAPARRR